MVTQNTLEELCELMRTGTEADRLVAATEILTRSGFPPRIVTDATVGAPTLSGSDSVVDTMLVADGTTFMLVLDLQTNALIIYRGGAEMCSHEWKHDKIKRIWLQLREIYS